MTAGEFVYDRLGRWLLWFGLMVVTVIFLLATGTQRGVLLIISLAWSLLFAALQVFDFLRCRAHIKELAAIMDVLDQKYLFAECVQKPQGIYERAVFALMRRSGKAMIEAVSEARHSQREYREYIESWVHEIKTPITAAKLLCRSAQPDLRRKFSGELAQIDNHVERALFYARAESPEKDFVIRQMKLEEIVAGAIEQHRSLLIQNTVTISTEDLEYEVYTDGKWVSFLLGQLLQNAARYHGEAPAIEISARKLGRQVQLTMYDNGMGIPSHELPRIFERGFTGSNGRLRGGATGIGLYLCKRLADFLEIDLLVKSQEGQSTSVILTFPAKENLSKV